MLKVIRKANEKDIDKLKDFLEEAEISLEGIDNYTIYTFLLLENTEGRLEASIGIEKIEQEGILRSLVITPSLTQEDIIRLFQQVEHLAIEHEISNLYLVTNKLITIEFFKLFHFKISSKNSIPASIMQSDHLMQSIKLENTIIMKREVKLD